MKKTLTALALAAVLGVTACGATDTVDGPAKAPETTSAAAQPAAETEAPEAKSSTAEFGETWTYEDGVTMTVELVGPAQAGEWSAGAEGTNGQIVLFDVTLTNGTAEPFDPALWFADVNYGTTGTAAARVFDSENGLGDNFQGRILPGGTQKVTLAYAIPHGAPQDILMTTSPSWDHNEAMFYGVAVAL